jgi:hypothetical protein
MGELMQREKEIGCGPLGSIVAIECSAWCGATLDIADLLRYFECYNYSYDSRYQV